MEHIAFVKLSSCRTIKGHIVYNKGLFAEIMSGYSISSSQYKNQVNLKLGKSYSPKPLKSQYQVDESNNSTQPTKTMILHNPFDSMQCENKTETTKKS